MQEKVQIGLSAIAVEGIKAHASEIELIIYNELLANKSKVEDLVVGYYFRSRGRVYDLRIFRPELNENNSGSFIVRYSLGHFNACADIDTSQEEKMTIRCDVDLDAGVAILTGEFIPEREPDEF